MLHRLFCLEKLSPGNARLDIAKSRSRSLGDVDCDEHLVDALSPPMLDVDRDLQYVLLGIDPAPCWIGIFRGLRDDLGVDVLETAAESLLLLNSSCCWSRKARLIADTGLSSSPSLNEGQLPLRTITEREFERSDAGRTLPLDFDCMLCCMPDGEELTADDWHPIELRDNDADLCSFVGETISDAARSTCKAKAFGFRMLAADFSCSSILSRPPFTAQILSPGLMCRGG